MRIRIVTAPLAHNYQCAVMMEKRSKGVHTSILEATLSIRPFTASLLPRAEGIVRQWDFR